MVVSAGRKRSLRSLQDVVVEVVSQSDESKHSKTEDAASRVPCLDAGCLVTCRRCDDGKLVKLRRSLLKPKSDVEGDAALDPQQRTYSMCLSPIPCIGIMDVGMDRTQRRTAALDDALQNRDTGSGGSDSVERCDEIVEGQKRKLAQTHLHSCDVARYWRRVQQSHTSHSFERIDVV